MPVGRADGIGINPFLSERLRCNIRIHLCSKFDVNWNDFVGRFPDCQTERYSHVPTKHIIATHRSGTRGSGIGGKGSGIGGEGSGVGDNGHLDVGTTLSLSRT